MNVYVSIYLFLLIYFILHNNLIRFRYIIFFLTIDIFNMLYPEHKCHDNLYIFWKLMYMCLFTYICIHIMYVWMYILLWIKHCWSRNHYLGFWHTFGNSNVFNLFPTASGGFLIFYMSISSDNPFPWVPLYFTLWPWPSFWKFKFVDYFK